MLRLLLDSFSSWLCDRRIVWLASENGFLPARVAPLCIARLFGVSVCWEHLMGRMSINTVDAAVARVE